MGAEKIGEYLKRERELRGITLEEISEGTKISKRLLEYMEAGRWDELPGEIFAKGFLKSYAEFIGISPEEILLRYEEEIILEEGERETGQENVQKGRLKNVMFFLAILIFTTIIGYLSYRVISDDLDLGSKGPVTPKEFSSNASPNVTGHAPGLNSTSPSTNSQVYGKGH